MRLALLSLLAPYLLGLGLLGVAALPPWMRTVDPAPEGRARVLAIVVGLGALLNHLLVLLTPDLAWAAGVGALLSIAGLALGVRERLLPEILGLRWLWLAVTIPALLWAGQILFTPLSEWDARSIWFFHAKIIHANEGLRAGPDWTNAAHAFAHLDYPKLIPILAAQIATLAGYWNEHLPKASLLVPLLVALFALASLTRPLGSWLFLLFALLGLPGRYLWNGYMDGYLGLFAALAAIFLALAIQRREASALALGATCLGIATGLKNEGMLFGLSLALAALPILARSRARAAWPALARERARGAITLLVLCLAGAAVWTAQKAWWKLTNDLDLGVGSLARVQARLGSPADLAAIARTLLIDGRVLHAAALLALASGVAAALRARPQAAAWLPAATALVYLGGIFAVFLATPYEFGWHLRTAGARTMLSCLAMLCASTYLVLRAIETGGGGERAVDR